MNKRKAHLILSWLLLLFFVAGQIIVFAHQHHTKYADFSIQKNHSHPQIIHEKCNFCDQMHHAPINLVQVLNYSHLVSPIVRLYIPAHHFYQGNSLIHADGLSPPAMV